MSEKILDFGLDTFGETMVDGDGRHLSDAETIRVMMDEAVLAESVGIDSYNIGEHYRPDNVDSAGHVILAAIASRTSKLKLGTAVTVLSTQDPVRVYQNFATLDAVSNGRAQLIVGRASATDSFPLFGYNIEDYETLFEEKLDLLVKLLRSQPVTWSGTTRSALSNQLVKPAIAPGNIPTWVGVGGSPHSVLRAARHGLPLMLAIIGGKPSRFAPFVELYEKALEQLGQPQLPIGMHGIGHIAATDEEAIAAHWPQYQAVMSKMVEERGFPMPTPAHYEREVSYGALMVGSPETVAQKIVKAVKDLKLSRFDLKHDIGRLSRPDRAESIRLYGTEVIPRVRELLAAEPVTTDAKEPAHV